VGCGVLGGEENSILFMGMAVRIFPRIPLKRYSTSGLLSE